MSGLGGSLPLTSQYTERYASMSAAIISHGFCGTIITPIPRRAISSYDSGEIADA
jgi:hypothetical protein